VCAKCVQSNTLRELIAVCSIVLQCVAVCCSVLQCVARRGRVMQCVAEQHALHILKTALSIPKNASHMMCMQMICLAYYMHYQLPCVLYTVTCIVAASLYHELKRALFILKRALFILKRALCILEAPCVYASWLPCPIMN